MARAAPLLRMLRRHCTVSTSSSTNVNTAGGYSPGPLPALASQLLSRHYMLHQHQHDHQHQHQQDEQQQQPQQQLSLLLRIPSSLDIPPINGMSQRAFTANSLHLGPELDRPGGAGASLYPKVVVAAAAAGCISLRRFASGAGELEERAADGGGSAAAQAAPGAASAAAGLPAQLPASVAEVLAAVPGLEGSADKIAQAIPDVVTLVLHTRTGRLKKIGVPCQQRKKLLRFLEKLRQGRAQV